MIYDYRDQMTQTHNDKYDNIFLKISNNFLYTKMYKILKDYINISMEKLYQMCKLKNVMKKNNLNEYFISGIIEIIKDKQIFYKEDIPGFFLKIDKESIKDIYLVMKNGIDLVTKNKETFSNNLLTYNICRDIINFLQEKNFDS